MLLLDKHYQKARASIRRKDEFFASIRFAFNFIVFTTLDALFDLELIPK
jgi:hypothetical protein